MDTIVASATPLSNGGVSIVRLSGDKACELASEIVEKNNSLSFLNNPRTMQLVKLNLNGITDKCLAVYFKAPFSFTGEDVVEFQIHGGAKLTLKVINKLIDLGTKEAEPGEFSKRAFLNGKLSLDEAEGIVDIIIAESDAQIEAASKLSSGEFFEFVKSSQSILLDALANLDVLIDYEFDEEVGETAIKKIFDKVTKLKQSLQTTLNSYNQGKLIKSGLNVAIIGATNAGKSSLLNAIAKSDVAIVSNIAGTTRDVVKESVVYKGVKLNFLDTAGLRDTTDVIEKLGIDKSYKAAVSSDIILYLVDATKKLDKSEIEYIKTLEASKTILVLNKIDGKTLEKAEKIQHLDCCEISAKNKINIETLLDKILDKVKFENISNNSLVLTNERHFKLVKKSIDRLTEVEELINNNETIELISFALQGAYNALGEITGEVGADKIIDKIFESFCVGK